MLPPYNTVHKFAAIVLDDVERVVIGDSSLNTTVSENVFEKSRFGIFSNRSSLELFNNSFKDMEAYDEPVPNGLTLHWPKLTYFSIGIYNLSDFDFNDRKITIGEDINFSGSDTRNSFSNINYGIYSQNESNVKIRWNDFGIGNEDFDNGSVGISINNPGNKTVDISNRNEFKSYTYGIFVYQLSRGTNLSVNNNKFYYGWTNNSTYTGTGISILNASPVKPLLAEVKGNILGDYINSNFYFPRIGIRAAKVEGINISNDNQINFNLATTPSGYYSGIWLQDCDRAKVIGNKLTNISSPSTLYTLNDLLVGLRIDESHGTCIEQNSMVAMGQGMRFSGNSIVYSLYNNVTNGFDQGVYLNAADIGSQQGWNGTYIKNDLNNSWDRSSGPTSDRIQGQTLNGNPINWYTRSTSPTDARYPDGDLFVVNPFPITSTAPSHSQCPVEDSDDPPYSNNERNAWFGAVTGDSARYVENYYHQFKYSSELVLFSELKRYSALLAMNDSADASFQDFFEAKLSSNYALFDSIIDLVNSDLLSDALQITEEINDTNDIEFCMKRVFQLSLNSRISGVGFTSQDTTLLDSIAELNAIINGPGVLMARILLNKEKYDYLSSGSRILSPTKRETSRVLDMRLYPNPARDILFISPSQISDNYTISITDLTGRELLRKNNQFQIETTSINSGSYLLVYEAEEQRVVKKFEIIN